MSVSKRRKTKTGRTPKQKTRSTKGLPYIDLRNVPLKECEMCKKQCAPKKARRIMERIAAFMRRRSPGEPLTVYECPRDGCNYLAIGNNSKKPKERNAYKRKGRQR